MVTALTILMLCGGVATATWLVGLDAGSNGKAKAAKIDNLSITAASTPGLNGLLYPGGTGDVTAAIKNPNPFPVVVSALYLPAHTTYAPGYKDDPWHDDDLIALCDSSRSLVSYTQAAATSGAIRELAAPLVVAANGQLSVTLTDAASMGSESPNECQGAYFSMPSFTGISASPAPEGVSTTTSPVSTSLTASAN
ncbi:hypothetical protein [Geodermatophilus sabuli]|uniref:hypothetical protein n=1 Tax=Geodermatophilus sabuli TaxID=1564158 RepID=UPI00117A32EE|nr:hypothetical protein [Geodermatophilus sabuli]MBB3086732.1 hypothetical protein [Geodermatophilus sabuli]